MSNWTIWKTYHNCLFLLLFFVLGACASVPAPPPPTAPPAVTEKKLSTKPPSDLDMVHKGIAYLGDHEKKADYAKAREAFVEVLATYPDSKWRKLSEAVIGLIDSHKSSEERFHAEKTRLQRENDQLRKENRRMLDELAKLIQESEHLKIDIQRLKSLEIQLEKREKMLR